MPLSFRGNNLLNGSASIAIWNRKKSIIVIAAGVWAANVGFLIHSKPLHPVSYRLLSVAFKLNSIIVLVIVIMLLLINAHWLAPLGLPRIGGARSGTPYVDTGGGFR
jgi:hypothetical protein